MPSQSNREALLAPLKGQLAAATRVLNAEDILSYSGHVAARLPGEEAFLMHGINDSRAKVSPDMIGLVDFDLEVLEGPEGFKPPREAYIHSEIFRARPDVNAIVHIHAECCVTFTMVEGLRLVPLKSHAVRWRSGIPVHGDPSHIKSPAQGQALAETLGAHQGALIRAHGGVVVAEDLPSLLIDAVHFDENARACLQAASLGRLLPLADDELDRLEENNDNRRQHVYKLWHYYLGKAVDDGIVPPDWPGIAAEPVF